MEEPPKLTSQQLSEIGRVLVTFNQLEALVRHLVWRLSGVDDDAVHVVTLGDSFPALTRKLRYLVPIRVTDEGLREKSPHMVIRGREGQRPAGRCGSHPLDGNKHRICDAAEAYTIRRLGVGLTTLEQIAAQADVIRLTLGQGVELWRRLSPASFGREGEDTE